MKYKEFGQNLRMKTLLFIRTMCWFSTHVGLNWFRDRFVSVQVWSRFENPKPVKPKPNRCRFLGVIRWPSSYHSEEDFCFLNSLILWWNQPCFPFCLLFAWLPDWTPTFYHFLQFLINYQTIYKYSSIFNLKI